MEDLTYTISRLCNLLEDAIEEYDWELAKTVSDELSDLHEELDKSDYANQY